MFKIHRAHRFCASIAATWALYSAPAWAIDADFVIDQHNWVVETVVDAPAPVLNRAQTMADVAGFDAINAVAPRYRAYRAAPAPQPGALAEAALLTSHFVMLSSMPELDAEKLRRHYQDAMDKLPATPARRAGVLLGRRAAAAMFAERAGDDFFERVEPVKGTPEPGVYQLTPGFPQQVGAEFTRARPFSVPSIGAFDPGPPPAPGSDAALRELRDVLDVGALKSRTRSAEQTAAAIFWNAMDDSDQMGQLRDAVHGQSLDALDAARWLALRSIAAFDTRIAILSFKHRYDYWRPYTAARHASTPEPLRDAQWQPLLRTHPHQDYPSAAGALMGAYVIGFERASALGPLSMYDSLTGQTREWGSPAAMAQELLDARVWAGVHFRAATTAGYRMGREIARAVYERELRPL